MEAEAASLGARERLDRDLHDSVGAHLTQIALLADWERHSGLHVADSRYERLSRATREAVQSLKDITWSTHPVNDTLGSLVTRIELHASEVLEAARIRCRLDLPPGLPQRSVSLSVRTAVFFAAKEALHNAVRHSKASTVRLRVAADAPLACIDIEDDGGGFDLSSGPWNTSRNSGAEWDGDGNDARVGLGLRSMRRRIESIGGIFELESHPGAGTRVRFLWPTSP